MLIGNHFGKRKPQWNFFIRSYESFKYGWSFRLIKILCFGLMAQIVLLLPVIYWIYQNYALIEMSLPAQYHLQENIQFEKKWIVFLIIGTAISQGLFNFFLWKTFLKRSSDGMEFLTNAKPVLRDEVDYQRRAS
ncbi:MAG: hypothetical protein H7328_13370 [Bdellovibrio sp.]|nr:hypothetical protein [Bdellovibrio sp.]